MRTMGKPFAHVQRTEEDLKVFIAIVAISAIKDMNYLRDQHTIGI